MLLRPPGSFPSPNSPPFTQRVRPVALTYGRIFFSPHRRGYAPSPDLRSSFPHGSPASALREAGPFHYSACLRDHRAQARLACCTF
ncbi:hypothetical protein GUJ93_ZPchr0009g375 [Zizania palustris]|uniref:Uncharacterized protein n=1 Tax=Zizania palustris TaxID=103762 RepID=A0A8J5VKR4_ZIZPA|nr:hypothetical protein GUJ93_ZPchr0009g375 [Zizania palustris]